MEEIKAAFNLKMSNSYIIMSKHTDPEIAAVWQNAVEDMKTDGTFEKLCLKWVEYTRELVGVDAEYRDGALNFWVE